VSSIDRAGMNTHGTAPDTMRALEALKPDSTVTDMKITDSRPVAHPVLQDGDAPRTVNVKIVSAALNPVDYKILGGPVSLMVKTWPHVTGCDMAGTVAEIEEGCMRKVLLYASQFERESSRVGHCHSHGL
jgi:NADPH:quinone reductase-like Zn-dependent oxidoreductase